MIKSEPNTYSYTKAITEDLVAEYGQKFPIAIARPSIGETNSGRGQLNLRGTGHSVMLRYSLFLKDLSVVSKRVD